MSSNRRPRLTPRGETYLAARDLAVTMARADTPTSRAWLEGFLDGIRAHDAELQRERAVASRMHETTLAERDGLRDARKLDADHARALAEEIGEE